MIQKEVVMKKFTFRESFLIGSILPIFLCFLAYMLLKNDYGEFAAISIGILIQVVIGTVFLLKNHS